MVRHHPINHYPRSDLDCCKILKSKRVLREALHIYIMAVDNIPIGGQVVLFIIHNLKNKLNLNNMTTLLLILLATVLGIYLIILALLRFWAFTDIIDDINYLLECIYTKNCEVTKLKATKAYIFTCPSGIFIYYINLDATVLPCGFNLGSTKWYVYVFVPYLITYKNAIRKAVNDEIKHRIETGIFV